MVRTSGRLQDHDTETAQDALLSSFGDGGTMLALLVAGLVVSLVFLSGTAARLSEWLEDAANVASRANEMHRN